ncbi:helix-turn-helix domain-containing protein [Pseudorhodoferax soli]|uniref:AraC family transcriptional regulator n=1 Tax=Pseudorhodoferax soli TaxID=545864 RepID=A0A368XFL0_9BURK|nr:helix-turn-helix domain-containing protein [Pseudorhodoferax soli]RCW66771.1 AraC family transcriptional regulator [Pseudorhodoferax soli]
MTPSLLLSTDAVAPRDRAPQWREWIWRHFGGLESDLYGDSDFDGRLSASRAGDVVLTRLEAGRHRVLRTPQMARRDEAGYLKIVAPWQGSAEVEQQGRKARAQAGGWIIYDTTHDYAIDNPAPTEHLIVMLPKRQMAERGVRLDPLMARHVGGASGISRVALETMRNTYLELPAMSETAARGAGELIMQLVQLSLLELAGQGTAVTLKQALRDRIRDHVARHLRDPLLSIEQIAAALNCSKRHLHNAFAEGDLTLASYIQQQRLQACIQELRQAPAAGRSITDIALAWGFSNMSHFARVFREHTGLSPSEFRQAARTGGG